MAKKKSARTIVGSPLTPALLKELGAIGKFPPVPKGLAAKAPARPSTYRIWTCHGYRQSGNDNVGFVTIRSSRDGTGKLLGVGVKQEIALTEGSVYLVDANIKCHNNQLASPVRWDLKTSFIKPGGGTEHDDFERVDIDGSTMTVRTYGRTLRRSISPPLACDWCLFEAVGHLSFDKKSALQFNLLEGLTVYKPNQRISYRGQIPVKMGAEKMTLHRFDQLGPGILPTEYWLDSRHRLLAVTSMNKAYILDDQIEPRDMIEQLRKSR